jgi:hypothetical protein
MALPVLDAQAATITRLQGQVAAQQQQIAALQAGQSCCCCVLQ